MRLSRLASLVFFVKAASAAPSACNNGPYGYAQDAYAFTCPQHAMLSDALIDIAGGTGLVYATAGGSSDGECGKCYQVELLDAEILWRPDLPQLVVQVINSGFDVLSGQLDLYMGAGGFGYFTACNTDCAGRSCAGGPCHASLSGGDFDAWTHSLWTDPNPCYNGGVRILNQADDTWARCEALQAHDEIVKSCARTNLQLLHQNFVSTVYRRVQCPAGLVNLTGMQRSDDPGYPLPAIGLELDQSCTGDRRNARFCVTTMQDCCVPSCSWPDKAPTVGPYHAVYTCDRHGNTIQS